MKCHYEVLDVPRDANNDDLKRAYRKAALKWHPDKNLDNPENAKEQFQLVQQAYEVLSDTHERAWYDSHRDAILKGGLGGDYKDDSFDIFPYFTASCFKGFNDDDSGFYSVYCEVFNKIAAEESEFLDDGDSDFEVPSFGMSSSDFKEVVQPFYAHWQNFTTKKSFSWLDQYDIRDLPNRRVAKLVEKENKKIRDRARKERNELIRNLVAFVRKRDKRVQAQAKIIEQQHAEKARVAAEKRKAKVKERQQELQDYKESEWSKFSNFEDELKSIEKSLRAEYGDSDVSSEDGVEAEDGEDSNLEDQELEDEVLDALYCPACQKLFKTVKAFANHENSKKHKENVELLKQSMLEEEEENGGGLEDDDSEEDMEDEEIEDEEIEDKETEKLDSAAHLSNLESDDDDDSANAKDGESNVEPGSVSDAVKSKTDHKVRKRQENKPLASSDESEDSSEEFAMLSKKQRKKLQQQKKLHTGLKKEGSESDDASEKERNKLDPPTERAQEDEEVVPLKQKLKGKKAKEARKQKRLAEAGDGKTEGDGAKLNSCNNTNGKAIENSTVNADLICVSCSSKFPSKNKLFEHLKKTGHSVYVPKSKSTEGLSSSDAKSKKKGRKK